MKTIRRMLQLCLCVFFAALLMAELILFSHTDMYVHVCRRWRSASAAAQVGEIVLFGRYEQDDDLSNGPEDIEWIVLDKRDGKLLLMTKSVLVKGLWVSSTWEESKARQILNQRFYYAAFLPDERNQILMTINYTEDTVGADEKRATEDKIFLLSKVEVERYLLNDESRVGYGTRYADDFGWYDWFDDRLWPFANLLKWSVQDYQDRWWLRTPGKAPGYIACVDENGEINADGESSTSGAGLRCALWLDCSGG